jgi:hypothetical protein
MGAREAIAKLLTGIKTYHSSPHDFPAFDLSKAYTGEGAMAYGHGTYSADSPAVSGQGGQYWNQFLNKFSGGERDAATTLRSAEFDRERAIASIQRDIEQARQFLKEGFSSMPAGDARVAKALAAKEQALRLLESGAPVGPRTYELNIRSDPATMLNWDQTIEKQPNIWDRIPANTRNHIDELYDQRGFNSISDAPEAYTGKDLYKALTSWEVQDGFPDLTPQPLPTRMGGIPKQQASQFLDEIAGIPGIKYLDAGSRLSDPAARLAEQHGGRQPALEVATQNYNDRLANPYYAGPADRIHWRSMMMELEKPESSNYVSFNPARDIDIMKKYGVIGAPAGALAMGSTYDQSQYQAPDPLAGTIP